ncbi:nucleoside transporter [bacterium]|nr:nucleoside transporter [candidate division CSSED10-310 bacterium]
MDVYNIVSFLGLFVLIGIAWLLSNNRKAFNWRVVAWGVGIQFVLGGMVFLFPNSNLVFKWLNDAVVKVLDSAMAGTRFLFGNLATADPNANPLGFILAFQGLPAIVFFSALMAILYYYRVMPLIIRGFANLFTRLMRISGAESLCAASNIFVGIESALTVRPYLLHMTRSEFCTVLTAGMATVASNVLVVYVSFLYDMFPTIAGHLISASILSAPAAVVMSKILYPETEHPKTLGLRIEPHYDKEPDVFTAIINGANAGIKLIAGIAAMLLAVLGLVALVDMILGVFGSGINALFDVNVTWTLKTMLGYLFYPFTLIIGIPLSDAGIISQIIGERAIVTELVAYQDLAVAIKDNLLHHPRSAVVTTYALCGFAHVASIAIFVGGVAALVPERTRDVARSGLRALLAATFACLMTACIAGTFFNDSMSTILLGK